ncbi:MAG: hypothetical protein WC384_05265 [Prolixibacteraceae bacterium]|jgi:hypothetical protein
MNEQEFDQRIKESAQLQESGIVKPLWNKSGTWNRIESSLEKKDRAIFWKIAVVVLLFFSIGITYAGWVKIGQYKSEKQLEFSGLQQQLNAVSADFVTESKRTQIIIQQKNKEIDSLKSKLLFENQLKAKNESQNSFREKKKADELVAKLIKNERLIDSLKSTINQMKLAAIGNKQSEIQGQRLVSDQNVNPKVNDVAPERQIHYISNHFQPEVLKKKKNLKIGFFGSPENSEIEYQSEHSIFKK